MGENARIFPCHHSKRTRHCLMKCRHLRVSKPLPTPQIALWFYSGCAFLDSITVPLSSTKCWFLFLMLWSQDLLFWYNIFSYHLRIWSMPFKVLFVPKILYTNLILLFARLFYMTPIFCLFFFDISINHSILLILFHKKNDVPIAKSFFFMIPLWGILSLKVAIILVPITVLVST